MRIVRIERYYHPAGTIGRMFAEGAIFSTVERPWLDNEPFISCIPEGAYIVEPYSSAKYPDVYEIKDVPDRTHILFHAANYPTDVEGCVGVGAKSHDRTLMVTHSRDAMERFKTLMGQDPFRLQISQWKYPNG